MNTEHLKNIVEKLLIKPKGLLAIDESNDSCNKRFESVGIEPTESARREYRELLITAPEIEKYVSGYIMYDETIRQNTLDKKRFPDVLQKKGIEVGIKVDQGLDFFIGSDVEQVTKGLDGLRDRLVEYRSLYGATFTKWRVALHINTEQGFPSELCMIENAERLARYAKIVQEENMVPIIEPEILLEGTHTLDTCYHITAKNFDIVFQKLQDQEVYLPGLILKTSMIIPGNRSGDTADVFHVAEATVKCLREHVPDTIGGIVFLSGGQESILATEHLNKMHEIHTQLPWPLTFSYSRAIQNDALHYWAQHREEGAHAQQLLVDWAKKNSLASIGKFIRE